MRESGASGETVPFPAHPDGPGGGAALGWRGSKWISKLLEPKKQSPTVGATDHVGRIRELLVRAAYGVRRCRQGLGWMGIQ